MSESDARLAARLAAQAGALLLDLRATSGLTGAALGARGDHDANELLLRELAAARPDDAVLSEEAKDSPARLDADRVWIIDPLDGTREYGLPPRPDWAVHVALWERGAGITSAGITSAAVAQPSLDAVYASDEVHAGDGVALHPPRGLASATGPASGSAPVFLVSDSRPPAFAAPVAEALGAELRPMGSAGAKAMAVLRGDVAAYLHAGGQWEWDSAAPVGVACAAGLHASRVDGSPLAYNSAHPYLPDLLICRAELAAAIIAAIAAA